MKKPGYKVAKTVIRDQVKVAGKVYRNFRVGFLVAGILLLGIGIYGLLNPEMEVHARGVGLLTGWERTKSMLIKIGIGTTLLVIRFTLMRSQPENSKT